MTNRTFKRGGRGVFKCIACGHATRTTDQAADSECCADCYEIAGIYNAFQDGGAEAAKEYASEIRSCCAAIVAKGGTLDGDATELLQAIGDAT